MLNYFASSQFVFDQLSRENNVHVEAVSRCQPYVCRAVSALEKGLAAPIIILLQKLKNALTCLYFYELIIVILVRERLRINRHSDSKEGGTLSEIVAQCLA